MKLLIKNCSNKITTTNTHSSTPSSDDRADQSSENMENERQCHMLDMALQQLRDQDVARLLRNKINDEQVCCILSASQQYI